MKTERASGFVIRQRGESWQVDYGRDHTNRHVRKSYKTKSKALNAADAERKERMREDLTAARMSEAQRIDAGKALQKLKGRATILQAVDFWISAHPECQGLKIADLVKSFTGWMESTPEKIRGSGPYRETTVTDAKRKLSQFTVNFGRYDVSEVSAVDVEAWVDGLKGSQTNRDNIKAYVSMCYSWAVRAGKLETNPMEGMKKRKLERGIPTVWQPERVKIFLNEAKQCQAQLAILFFAGLRPTELLRIKPKDIDSEIHIRKEVSKTGMERLVTIHPNLASWLEAYPFKPCPEIRLRRERWRIMKALQVEWVQDLPRHCFATYTAALWGMDRAADELGHTSTQMLNKHYRGLVRNRREAGAKYFEIVPK